MKEGRNKRGEGRVSEIEREGVKKKEEETEKERKRERKPSRDDYERFDPIIIEMKIEYQRMEIQILINIDNIALKNVASIFCTPSKPIISLLGK